MAASFKIKPSEHKPSRDRKAANGEQHGEILVWNWGSAGAKQVACEIVWRSMYEEEEWMPTNGGIGFDDVEYREASRPELEQPGPKDPLIRLETIMFWCRVR